MLLLAADDDKQLRFASDLYDVAGRLQLLVRPSSDIVKVRVTFHNLIPYLKNGLGNAVAVARCVVQLSVLSRAELPVYTYRYQVLSVAMGQRLRREPGASGEWVHFPPFFADGENRQNHEKMQRVREGMELLNMLAMVNNAIFVQIASRFMTIEGVEDNDDAPPPICPTWKCRLVGKLSIEDPLSSEASVSWGDLLGFPNDEPTPGFRDIMDQLVAMSDETGEWWHSHSVVKWRTHHGAMPTRGIQRNPWGDSEPTSSAEMFAREFKRRLGFDVPPVVHLCATSDGTSVLETWRNQEPRHPEHQLENRLWTFKADFATPYVLELTKALARADMASFKVRLDDRRVEREQWGLAMMNTGILFSTMICGKSLCQFPGGTNGSIIRQGKLTDMRVVYPWASERILGGFYSALTMSRMTKVSPNAYLEDGDEDVDVVNGDDAWNHSLNHIQWRWLAYALWSRVSSPFVQQIDLATFRLTAIDASVMEAVLKSAYPKPVLLENNVSDSSEYGIVELRKGTRFQPHELDEGDDTTFILSEGLRCRARFNPTTMCEYADVVIPGFGVCRVNTSGEVNFVQDSSLEMSVGGKHSRPLDYFKIFVDEVESTTVLTDLLALIGGRLETLWFGNTGFDLLTIDLSDLAIACPQLEQLTLSDVSVVVGDDSEALRNWPLKTLMIDGVVSGLATSLSDPTNRMARELIDLNVDVPRNWVFNEETKAALRAHDGDCLFVVKESLPILSKAAMISVWTGGNVLPFASPVLDAARKMDENMLKLIFVYAATPKKRSVNIHNSGRFTNVLRAAEYCIVSYCGRCLEIDYCMDTKIVGNRLLIAFSLFLPDPVVSFYLNFVKDFPLRK